MLTRKALAYYYNYYWDTPHSKLLLLLSLTRLAVYHLYAVFVYRALTVVYAVLLQLGVLGAMRTAALLLLLLPWASLGQVTLHISDLQQGLANYYASNYIIQSFANQLPAVTGPSIVDAADLTRSGDDLQLVGSQCNAPRSTISLEDTSVNFNIVVTNPVSTVLLMEIVDQMLSNSSYLDFICLACNLAPQCKQKAAVLPHDDFVAQAISLLTTQSASFADWLSGNHPDTACLPSEFLYGYFNTLLSFNPNTFEFYNQYAWLTFLSAAQTSFLQDIARLQFYFAPKVLQLENLFVRAVMFNSFDNGVNGSEVYSSDAASSFLQLPYPGNNHTAKLDYFSALQEAGSDCVDQLQQQLADLNNAVTKCNEFNLAISLVFGAVTGGLGNLASGIYLVESQIGPAFLSFSNAGSLAPTYAFGALGLFASALADVASASLSIAAAGEAVTVGALVAYFSSPIVAAVTLAPIAVSVYCTYLAGSANNLNEVIGACSGKCDATAICPLAGAGCVQAVAS